MDSKVMKGVMMFLVHVVQRVAEGMEGWRNKKTRLVSWYVVVFGRRTAVEFETSRVTTVPSSDEE